MNLGGTARTAYEMILEAARCGLPCPTNGDVAQKIGAFSRSCAQDAFRKLELEGLIIVERPAGNKRIVTVIETGEKTGVTISGGLIKQRHEAAELLNQRRDAMLAMRAELKSVREIAKAFNVSKIAVAQVLRGPRGRRLPVVVPLDVTRVWCDQCQRRVRPEEGVICRSQFCAVERVAA